MSISRCCLFFCLPCLRPLFTVPCKMVLARPDERETCQYHFSLYLFTMVMRSSCCPTACWILALASSLVTRFLYEMRSIFRKHLISMTRILPCSSAVRVHVSIQKDGCDKGAHYSYLSLSLSLSCSVHLHNSNTEKAVVSLAITQL